MNSYPLTIGDLRSIWDDFSVTLSLVEGKFTEDSSPRFFSFYYVNYHDLVLGIKTRLGNSLRSTSLSSAPQVIYFDTEES